jgi:hypothetical protein
MIVVRDFLEWIEYYTQSQQKTLMILRTIGPDNVEDAEKANQIYSVYYQNLQPESPVLFDKLLYNEFTFVEFETEEEAYQFAIENFPLNRDGDPDYFVQVFVFSNGNLAHANDSLISLSDRVSPPVEPPA